MAYPIEELIVTNDGIEKRIHDGIEKNGISRCRYVGFVNTIYVYVCPDLVRNLRIWSHR